ncbi:MAG TPA: MerR family transcriptional regulator [Candidatus Dormibacteraeota bacterium]|nr:MerR family transcriptional regulator [Candidatus Dormibacteraeota bacterium]
MASEDRAVYSIGAVARMLDIPTATLRAWEDRYQLITPGRSAGAQRLYSRKQVEQLRHIKTQMESGMSAADAHRLLAADLTGGHVPMGVPEAVSKERPLILIAERDPYAADLAESFLRTEGFEVVIALDATQASLHFEERSPDVVVIDLLISGGAGYRLLRDFVAGQKAQVVAVSAIDSAEEATRGGAAAFLIKPLEPLMLVSTVRDLLGTSELVRKTSRTHRVSR